jgi:hypothetical protein
LENFLRFYGGSKGNLTPEHGNVEGRSDEALRRQQRGHKALEVRKLHRQVQQFVFRLPGASGGLSLKIRR